MSNQIDRQKPSKKALLAFNPCSKGKDFLEKHKSLQSAWKACANPDWMIWSLIRFEIIPDSIARTFACDCAEHTLHFFEEKYPEDKRPRLAIEASRRTILDHSDQAIAARAAARDAARAAARDAARAAARDAAWAAARAAAGAAAWDAAGAAARDAAGAAAWAAARDAAGAAAWAAARDAAGAAAGAAAWDAAGDAESRWQADHLRSLINPFKP